VFEYISRTKGPWEQQPLEFVLAEGLRMLDIAADLDSATGGFKKTLPAARVLDRNGNRLISEEDLAVAARLITG
jgi:proteasome beta subunit